MNINGVKECVTYVLMCGRVNLILSSLPPHSLLGNNLGRSQIELAIVEERLLLRLHLRLLGLHLRLLSIRWRHLITSLLLLSVRINLWLLAICLRSLVTSLLLTVGLLTVRRLLLSIRLRLLLLSIRLRLLLLSIRLDRRLRGLAVSRERPEVIISLSILGLLSLDHLNEIILLH